MEGEATAVGGEAFPGHGATDVELIRALQPVGGFCPVVFGHGARRPGTLRGEEGGALEPHDIIEQFIQAQRILPGGVLFEDIEDIGPACASAQKPTVSPARKLVAAL